MMTNNSCYFYNLRLPLLLDLRSVGYEVAVVVPHDIYTALLQAEGFAVHPWMLARRSINPPA
jgi:hypothetical protein